MLTLAKFCCQKPKPLLTTLIWGERGFFLRKNKFSILSQQFCPRLYLMSLADSVFGLVSARSYNIGVVSNNSLIGWLLTQVSQKRF